MFIPQFFDYKKKEKTIRSYLSEIYGIDIKDMDGIEFKSLPSPHLEIDNSTANYFSKDIKLKIKKLVVYPKLLSIYNYDNFQVRKIKLENSSIEIDFKDTHLLLNKILNYKKKLYFKDINLKIKNSNKKIIELKKIDFFNYGYKKNEIKGEIFKRKFLVNLENDLKKIDFKILEAGIYLQLHSLNKDQNLKKGSVKGTILKSNYKFDYNFNGSLFKINNFIFRNKNLSFDSKGIIELKPFFKIILNSEVQSINKDIFENLDINSLLNLKNLFKRFNSQNEIVFRSKKFQRNLINELEVKTNLAYGRLDIFKNIYVFNTKISCQNNVNLLDEYPVINFDCSINSPDQKIFFKKIKIDIKNKNKSFDLKVRGNLNILNNKINFSSIDLNDNYKASKEDLKYFKSAFENILFDEGFMNIFIFTKIRKFILEIS